MRREQMIGEVLTLVGRGTIGSLLRAGCAMQRVGQQKAGKLRDEAMDGGGKADEVARWVLLLAARSSFKDSLARALEKSGGCELQAFDGDGSGQS